MGDPSKSLLQSASAHAENGVSKDQVLLHNARYCDSRAVPGQLMYNWILMSVAFSVNHATVTAMVGLASQNLQDLGNLQNALLYLFYTLTALLASKSIVGYTGAKGGILLGLGMYICYVGSFILADSCPSIKRPAAITGGCLGGVAAGFLWTAQFAYFGENADLYAEVSCQSCPGHPVTGCTLPVTSAADRVAVGA